MEDLSAIDAGNLSRRNFLMAGGAGAAVVAAQVIGAGPALATHGGRRAQVVVDVDTDGFNDFQGGDSGPFYVSGKIMKPDTTHEIGTFHCWGFISGAGPNTGVAVVSQEFHFDGRGSIQVSGVESDAPRAVTGGTGQFRSVRGEGFVDLTSFDDGKFRIAFRMTGMSGPPIP